VDLGPFQFPTQRNREFFDAYQGKCFAKQGIYAAAEVIKKLEADGWTGRKGKGDHLNFKKPGRRFVVTVERRPA
jgi:hypothetical protein